MGDAQEFAPNKDQNVGAGLARDGFGTASIGAD
jgi:hypothetical protein